MTESDVKTTSNSKEIEPIVEPEEVKSNQGTVAIIVIAVILIAIIAGIIVLSLQEAGTVTKVRDLFIILMALMTFVIGLALVILIVQVADLTNLLKNEIKPILNSTTDTVNTLKGTVRFMSDNLTEPVIKLNESLAGIKKILQLFNFKK
jgi:predicted PurR-regulated permease PerM